MTVPSATRAGGDRPHRRPERRRPIAGAVVVVLSALALALTASSAGAAEPQTTSPVLTPPAAAVIPPAPPLPHKPLKGKTTHERDTERQKGGRGAGDGKGAGASSALGLQGTCAPFSHTQTYTGWGPAVAFGRTVTVAYEASRCSMPDGSALDVQAEGTATIYDGASAEGIALATKPFMVAGTWRRPGNAEAWPPPWWACGVPFASYTWQIPGVYSFRVTVRDGLWTLDVASQGVGSQDVTWSHDGCA